jgi:Right handed beta helix region
MHFRLYLLFFLSPFFLHAQTQVFVSPTGNDANPGTLILPWQTVQHALNSANAGTTIYLMGGTYNENTTAVNSGTSNNPIILTSYNNQTAVISGINGDGSPLLEILNINYFTVSEIQFSNYMMNDAVGILVHGNSNHITIANNQISDIHFSPNPNDPATASTNAQPLIVYGDDPVNPITDLSIHHNEIYNCRPGYSEALAVNGNVDGFTINHNLVHDITNIGIDLIGHEGTCSTASLDQARNGTVRWNRVWNCVSLYATSAGIYADGARDCIIENNTVYGNGWGIEVGCENVGKTSTGMIVRSNTIYNNLAGGLVFGGYDYPAQSGKISNCSFTNNTIVANEGDANATADVVISYCENVVFKNNIVQSGNTVSPLIRIEANPSGIVSDYNLLFGGSITPLSSMSNQYYTVATWSAATGFDTHSLEESPLFVNEVIYNFHQQSNSPCIDQGDSLYVQTSGETDIDTMNRVQNGRVDIGADEFGTAVGIPVVQLSTIKMVYEAANTSIHLYFPNQHESGFVEIYNAAGQIVRKAEFKSGENEFVFSVAELAAGLYYLNTSLEPGAAHSFLR